jgi:hypothetical protein
VQAKQVLCYAYHEVTQASPSTRACLCSVDVSSCKAYIRLAWAQACAVYLIYLVVLGQARWMRQSAQAWAHAVLCMPCMSWSLLQQVGSLRSSLQCSLSPYPEGLGSKSLLARIMVLTGLNGKQVRWTRTALQELMTRLAEGNEVDVNCSQFCFSLHQTITSITALSIWLSCPMVAAE